MSDEPCVQIESGIDVSFAANAEYRETVEGPTVAAWSVMTEAERDKELAEIAQDTLGNQVEAWAHADPAAPPDGWERVECPTKKFVGPFSASHEISLKHHCGQIECRLTVDTPEDYVAKLRKHEGQCPA